MTILADVHQILVRAGKPLHYRHEVLKILREEYQYELTQADIDATYNAMYNDIRKNGEHARFKRVGRAVFVAIGDFNPGTMEVAKPNRSKWNPEGQHLVVKQTPKICGRCRFIEFTGVQEATLANGTCSQYADSGRVGVQSGEDGCPLWQKRSEYVRNKEHIRQIELRAYVSGINRKIQRERIKRMHG